jgi:hypothetical protein
MDVLDYTQAPHVDTNSNLKLIADNWDILLPAAERAFEEHGRGTILVDTTRIENGGYPFQYIKLTALPNDDADCGRMVRTYDPEKAIIVSLFRADGRVYSYQLGRPGDTKVSRR